MISSDARQFSIIERPFVGPVLYVRKATFDGVHRYPVWGKWRKATHDDVRVAIAKLTELDRGILPAPGGAS